MARNRSGSAPRGESAFDPNPDLTFDANLVADDIGGALLALGSIMRGDIIGPTGREMDWESDTAKEYRNRAEELRATAERMTDEESRKTLISIAAVYDRCAAMVEGTVKKDAASLPKNSN